MASVSSYYQGELVRISGAFTNAAGAATDPTAVTFLYSDPSGNTTTLVYGTDAALVKDSTGNYHVDITTDEGGAWFYRWVGTGAVVSADQGWFFVVGAKPAATA